QPVARALPRIQRAGRVALRAGGLLTGHRAPAALAGALAAVRGAPGTGPRRRAPGASDRGDRGRAGRRPRRGPAARWGRAAGGPGRRPRREAGARMAGRRPPGTRTRTGTTGLAN